MIYEWKITGIFKIDPKLAGEEIEKCVNEQGYITKESVLDQAKNEENPLHSCFEWDDQIAGNKYRLHQASEILRFIITKPEDLEDAPKTRAFVHIVNEENEGYKTINTLSCDEFNYILECALKELRDFKNKYANLKELSAVIEAANNILGE